MDPFIEACDLWADFHFELIHAIKDQLAAALPAGYAGRTGKRCYSVLELGNGPDAGPVRPDAIVSSVAVGEVEPVNLRAFIEQEHREPYLDVFALQPERQLVTRIEVLSPSNKQRRSKGWKKYLRKRQALLLGKANMVEIDLLRGGDRMPMFDPWPTSPYTLLVAREERAPYCRVWPAFFDRPLPAIPVPLSRPDPDVPLELQPLVDAIYERSRYREDIDYVQPLTPPLSGEQAAWLAQQLRGDDAGTKPPRPRRG
jgi:hypothetical protein